MTRNEQTNLFFFNSRPGYDKRWQQFASKLVLLLTSTLVVLIRGRRVIEQVDRPDDGIKFVINSRLTFHNPFKLTDRPAIQVVRI